MAVPKRKNEYLGLKNLDVLVEDTVFDSQYFRVLECPVILTQGKSSFLIGGSSDLKSGVEVKIELVNNNTDETIYIEPIRGHLEGNLRRVSIEVYNDVTPGSYTLYVVGELDPVTSGVSIPTEWQNIYNVRWSKQITVNGMGVNTQPILFYKQPSINVTELFTGFVEVPSGSATTVYLTGSGEPRQGLTPIAPVENATGGGFGTSTYPELDFANKAKLSIIEENKPLVKLSGKHGLIGSQGKQVQTMSPVPNDYVITVSGNSTINSLYVGHNITINNPQIDISKFTTESYHEVPSTYSSTVMKVLNKTTFVPKDVFYVYDNRTSPATLVPAPFTSIYPISASYLTLPTQNTSSINLLSFGDIEVSDLRTFSGDVHKLKIYAKSEGSLGDFEKIYDSPIESYQVLFDKSENTLLSNMGYWLNSSRINNYWEVNEGVDGTESGTLTYDAIYINDAMKVSGSNKEYGDVLRVQNKTAVDFIAGNLYTFKAKLYGIKRDKKDIDGTVTAAASFKVFAKGDAFNKDTTDADHWGVEKLSVPDIPDGSGEYEFGIVEGSFLADNTGTGYIQFKIDSGEWYVSDISVKASSDTAFNPDFVRVKAPVPPLLQRPDRIRFLVEFYDVNNNIADSVIFSEPFDFQGANINISGTDNILSGSMVIGSALGAGIELAGVGSGFVRSIGYKGFTSASAHPSLGPGFLMWSGSVLTDITDDYNTAGVGLELVGHSGSYFRFRTNPSELDIRADAFFVGDPNSQYISGSGNQIEISSSNFHVSSSGDVSMTGTITATAGNIGNWQIIDGKLSGSNATLDADGAALYKTDTPPDTHPLDGYYIDFTPGNYYIRFGTDFAVSSSGQLFASGAKIEGVLTSSEGYIGGWTIAPNTIHKLTSGTYTGLSSTGDTRFFGGAASLTATGSAPFNVKSTGDITGSSVLFTGGKIAGWTISGDDLTATNMALRAGDAIEMGSATDLNTGDGVWIGNSGYFRAGDADGQRVEFNGTNLILSSSNFFLGGAGQYVSGSNGLLEISSSGFYLDNAGNTTMQGTITATAGEIGGFSISSDAIYSSNFFLSGSATGNQYFISSSRFQVTADGDISGSQVLFTGGKIAGFELSGNTLTATYFTLDASGKSITLGNTATDDVFIVDADTGIQLGHNTFSSAPFSVTKAGVLKAESGTIAGWTIDDVSMTGGDMIIRKDGTLESSGFASNVPGSGFRLTAASGGFLEVENARIRGTLSTAVFEKESVNAVGGQLYVANSTTLTSSIHHPQNYYKASDTTMSVVNVTGFVEGEILSAKKVSDSGFATEYILVQSASRDNASSDTDYSGQIYVTRGYGSGVSGDSGSLGDTPSTAQRYSGSQVIVSTGKINTGYIRLNANPNDPTTPYMDIVERTGSGIYDVELKARLGDLSGLSSGLLYGETNPGFGLFTENIFLQGSITAKTGSFIGAVHVGTGGTMKFGQNVSSTNDGIFINTNNFWYDTGNFKVGDGTSFISSSGEIQTDKFELKTNRVKISSTYASMSIGNAPTLTSGTGAFLSGSGEFRLGDDSSYIQFKDDSFSLTGADVDINVTDLNISASGFTLSSPQASMSLGNNNEILLHATGGTGGVPIFKLDGGEISASNFFVDVDGNLTASNARFDGIISSSEANIGGWTVDEGAVYKGVTRLSSSVEPGLYIEDNYGNPMVLIAEKSMFQLGSDPDEIKNESFEVTQSGEDTAGYHLGTSASPLTVHSWSFSSTGPVSHSITKRSGSGFSDFNAAVLGDFTFDVIHPGQRAPLASLSRSFGDASASYLSGNTYEFTQIVSASEAAGNFWKEGNVVSFAGVAKMSHSFGGAGVDRGFEKQKYKVDYWTGAEWITFIPKIGSRSMRSDGFAHYSMGKRYSSIAGAGALPANSNKLRVTLTGSINPDTTYIKTQYLYQGAVLDPMQSLPSNGPEVNNIVVLNTTESAKYAYTEITFDNFRLRQSQPRVELSPDGFLLYASDNSYLKMTPEGIDFRGGQGFSQTSVMLSGETNSDNIDVYGSLAAPSLQAYEADTAPVGTTGFQGNVNEFAMGNHRHAIESSTIDGLNITFTNGVWNSRFGAIAGGLISGSWQSQGFVVGADVSGSWQGYITGSGIVSASSIASSAQGQVALTTNGVAATAVDLGLQTGDSPTFASGTFSGLSNQGSENTSVMINGSGVLGTRELGSLAFSSATYDNYSSWTIGGDSGTSTVSSGETATVAGTAPISTVESGKTVTISVDNDGITDTHLAYNTGQHLTTTSNVTFGDISGSNLYITASGENVIRVGNSGNYMTKWEWWRNDERKWVIYNDGRTSPTLVQDALIFKSDNWGGDVNMALASNASVKFYGAITGSANLDIAGNALFGEYIYHRGDEDTFIRFEDDKINIEAGGQNMIYMVQGSGGDQLDKVTINNALDDVDFQVKGQIEPNLIRADVANNRVGIGVRHPTANLHISGTLQVGSGSSAGHITASGNIKTTGDVYVSSATPRIFMETGGSHRNYKISAQDSTTHTFEIASGEVDGDASSETWTPQLKIDTNTAAFTNKVGVGTAVAPEQLTVAGNVSASSFISSDTPWADIRAYGAAPGESAANNVTYIQKAINSLPSDGGTVFFPRGTYELSDTLWVSSSNVTFHSDSAILECNHTGPGIMISQSSADSRPSGFYMEGKLRITRDRSSYPLGTQDGSKGIHLSNTTYSHLRGFDISYFNYGLYLEGSGSGVAYNVFEPVRMVDNLVQVKFANSASNGTVGWVNQNTFNGGQWMYTSLYDNDPGAYVPPSSGSFVDMTINVDAQKQNNANNFMRMSMECSPSMGSERWAPAVKCYGTRNIFFDCRSENTNGWDFNHISSSFNTVMYGRFVSASTAGQDIFSTYPHDWGVSQKAHNNFIGVPKSSAAGDTVDRQGIFENVGIGTFDPDYPLHVSGSPATIKIEGGSGSPSWKARLLIDRKSGDRGGGIWIEDSDGDESKYWIGAPYNGGSNSGGISIGYHGTQPEYIANSLVFVDNTGKFGIGTTDPSVLLHAYGDTNTTNAVWGWIQNNNTGTSADAGLAFTGGGNNFNIGVDATTDSFVISDTGAGVLASNQRFVIDTAGNITASGHFVATNDFDLGSSIREWRDLYIDGTAYLDTANISAGTITGITDLVVADGGTGVSSFTVKSVIVSDDSSTTADLVAKQMDGSGELLIGGSSGPEVGTITADDGLAVTVGDGTIELDLDLKSAGGLAIESNELALSLGDASITGTLAVGDGGTGATTFTDGGILLGNTAGAIQATAVLTNGQLLIGDNSTDPTVSTLTQGSANQVIITNGAGSITLSTPQDIHTDADVTFDSLTLDDLTATRLVATDGSEKLISTDASMWITGSSNQITVTSANGYVTLSTPQDIHTSATPIFAGVSLTGDSSVTGSLVVTGNLTAYQYIVSSSTTYITTSFSAGNTEFGDSITDTHKFTGSIDITGSITPGEDNKFDLGSSGKEWKDLYIDGTANIDSLVADTADINAGTVDAITSLTVANDVDVGDWKITSKALEASDLIETQVVFAGANGLLANDSDLTFSGDTLTATKIGAFEAAGAIDFSDEAMTNVNIDSGIITGITDLAVADGGTGLSTVGTDYILTGNTTSALTAESALTFDGSTLTINNTVAGSNTFTSGFAGGGWRIDEGITAAGKASATFDNLTIRGTMSVYELLIHQIRATNGSIWVSNTGKIESSSYGAGVVGARTYTLFFSSGSEAGHGFMNADSIRSQRWSPTGDLYQSDLFVVSTDNTGSLTATLSGSSDTGEWSDEPLPGMEYVRIGNTATAESSSRQGAIYLTSDDDNAPYIDVVDGVTHHGTFNTSGNIKTRMGKLDGVTSPTMGTLEGYGFYASGSVWLEGKINATAGGFIGGWSINKDNITSPSSIIKLSSADKRISIYDGAQDRIWLGEVDGNSTYGMKIFDGVGQTDDDLLVELGEGGNIIAGWEISGSRIHKHNLGVAGSDGGLILDATNLRYDVYTGSFDNSTDGTIVRMGQIASNKFGILGNDTSGNLLFKLGMDGNEIVGWDLTPGNIVSDNTGGSVRLSSVSQSLTIWTGSVNEAEPKVVLGKLPLHDGTVDSPYGFAVFSGSGTVSGSESSASILITQNKARMAGWELEPGELRSGTVAKISGNSASIALGTGASTATGTPTDGLFFVSASASPVFYVGSNFSYVDDVLTAGGWKIGNNIISSSTSADTDGIILDSEAKVLTFHGADGKNSFSPGTATRDKVRLAVGQVDTDVYGMRAYDGSGNTLLSITDTPEALIAGWTIGTNTISSTNTILGLGYISLGSGTSGYGNANMTYIDGSANKMSIGQNFLYTGDELTVAGWNITSNAITSSNVHISASGQAFNMGDTPPSSWDSGAGIHLSGSGTMLVGDSTGNRIQFNGSTAIIRTNTWVLDATTIFMSSQDNSGTVRVGTLENTSTTATTNTGFMATGDGALLIKGDTSGDNYFKVGSGATGFQIKTQRLDLQTTGLKIVGTSGTAASNYISLGTTPPTAYDSGKGVWIDGGGKLLVGKSVGERIQYDGTNLIMSSSTFLMGTSGSGAYDGAYISGSNGILSISSSNFYLSPAGDVTMKGTISADDGDIGGFIIDTNDLYGGNAALNAATIVMGNLDGVSKIALGVTADTISTTAGTGFFASGDGKWKVGTTTEYIRFGNTANKLEINTAKFDLNTSGEITATGGTIAGWTINDDEIKNIDSDGGLALTTAGSQGKLIGYRDSIGDVAIQVGIGELEIPPIATQAQADVNWKSGRSILIAEDVTEAGSHILSAYAYTRVIDEPNDNLEYAYYDRAKPGYVHTDIAYFKSIKKTSQGEWEWLTPKAGDYCIGNDYRLEYYTATEGQSTNDLRFTWYLWKNGGHPLFAQVPAGNYTNKLVKVSFWYFIPNDPIDYQLALEDDNMDMTLAGKDDKSLKFYLTITPTQLGTTTEDIVIFSKPGTQSQLGKDISDTLDRPEVAGSWKYKSFTYDGPSSVSTAPLAYLTLVWQHGMDSLDDQKLAINIPRIVIDDLKIRIVDKPETQIYETGFLAFQEEEEKITFSSGGLDIKSAAGSIDVAILKTPSLTLYTDSGSNPSIGASHQYISGSTLSIEGQAAFTPQFAAAGSPGHGHPAGDLVLRTFKGSPATGSANEAGGNSGNIYFFTGHRSEGVGSGASGSYGHIFMGLDSGSIQSDARHTGSADSQYPMPDTLLTLKHPSASISLQFANGTDGAAAASKQTIGKIDFVDGDGTIRNSIRVSGSGGYGAQQPIHIIQGALIEGGTIGTTYPLEVAGYNSSNDISIYAEKDVAAYSDIRKKTDINTITGSLDIINNIRGITFRDKVGSGNRRMGVIAQELEPYLPEIVSTDEDGFKSVKYGNLTALLIQAVKEQQEQIEELKQQVKEIKDA